MTSLVEVNNSYAGDEKLQQVIIKCLDDDDKTIGKKVRGHDYSCCFSYGPFSGKIWLKCELG